MKGDTETDALLHEQFARLKAGDAERAPDFAAMIARAREEVARRVRDEAKSAAALSPQPRTAEVAVRLARGASAGTSRRALRWSVPLALAAGIAAIVLIPRLPDRAADREFDRLVSEWSRTTEATRHAPTDGLLALPGVGLMGSMPAIGSGIGAVRGQS